MPKKDEKIHEIMLSKGAQPKKAVQSATDELFRLVVDSVKDYAIYLLDNDGCVASWNAGAERLERYSAGEIIGKNYSVFFPQEEIESGTPGRQLDTALSSGTVEAEGWRLRKDGGRYWATISITALHDKAGNPNGFIKIVRDNTEQRNANELLQKSRDMLEMLFENAPESIVVVDNNGVIRKVNRHCETLFGYTREDLVGLQVEVLVPERFRKIHEQYRLDYFARPRARKMGTGLELFGRNREGGEIPVDIILSPMKSSEGIWVLAIIRDITTQKKDEEKIRELNITLKKQVAQLAEANRELETFSYSVSHDLRAPLRHITGFVKLLNKKNLEPLDPQSRHYLEIISESARKMGLLIDDLLNFSRMGRTEMLKTKIDFAHLVNEVASELTEDEKGRDIDWVIGALPVIEGDYSMLRQVMVNLLSNALKYTRTRPKTKIEIGVDTNRQDETIFYVRDNGVGFDMKYADKLFGVFQRLHDAEAFEGTGIGLANVQRIIHRHGGRIWAESTVDNGAAFWFSLPKAGKDPLSNVVPPA